MLKCTGESTLYFVYQARDRSLVAAKDRSDQERFGQKETTAYL